MDGLNLAKHLALVSARTGLQAVLLLIGKKKDGFPQGPVDRWVEVCYQKNLQKKT